MAGRLHRGAGGRACPTAATGREARGGHWTIRLTPEAGTIKTNEARTVVLHTHLVELGFPAFVEAAQPGHLFLKPSKSGDVLGPLQGLKNRLAESLGPSSRTPT